MVSRNREKLKWFIESQLREAENKLAWWELRIEFLTKMREEIEVASKREKSDH